MSSLISVLRFLLFFLCMGGYVLFLCDRFHLSVAFAPAVVFSSVICVLTFAGYLNILLFTSIAMDCAGFFLFLYYTLQSIRGKKAFPPVWKQAPKLCVIFFLVLLGYFVYLLRGARFTSYDDFSHWGVVVKEMLLFHRMPNAQSAVIDFKTYPLSSSLFIYFTDLLIGQTESKMLIAQMILILSYGFAFCGILSRSGKPVLQGIVLHASVWMIAGFTNYWRLWVDTLLPISGVAAAAVIVYNRNDIRRACLTALPILATMGLIKNSGIYFVLVIGVLLLYFTAKAKPSPRMGKRTPARWGYALGTLAFACMMVYLWHAHTNYVFPDQMTKHTMSLSNFGMIFSEKTNEQLRAIISGFAEKFLSLRTVSTGFLITINLSVVGFSLLLFLLWRIKMTAALKALAFSDGVFFVYLAGMLGMYLCSMPAEEAMRLAAYDRYAASAAIFQLGLVGIGLILSLEPLWQGSNVTNGKTPARDRFRQVFSAICALLLVWGSGHAAIGGNYSIFYSMPLYQQSLPAALDRVLPENREGYSNRRYLIYAVSDDPRAHYSKSYLEYIAQYKLYSTQIRVITEFNAAELLKVLPSYDDLVIIQSNRELDRFMEEYGTQKDAVGVYPIKNTFLSQSKR